MLEKERIKFSLVEAGVFGGLCFGAGIFAMSDSVALATRVLGVIAVLAVGAVVGLLRSRNKEVK